MSHDGDLQAAVRTWRLPRFGLVGALVALVIIGGRRVMTGSLWVDEAWSLAAFRHLRLSYQASGGSMIGYYAMMWPWARVSQAIWWLRLPSLLAGLGTMAATYRIVHKLFGERSRLAWAACVVLLWSPIFLWKSSEVRPYALETLLIALCWLAVIELATNPSSSKWATVFLVCAIVGPWVHQYPHTAVPGPAIGFLQEALRWWDRWLKVSRTALKAILPTAPICCTRNHRTPAPNTAPGIGWPNRTGQAQESRAKVWSLGSAAGAVCPRTPEDICAR